MRDPSILRTLVAAVSGKPPAEADWMEIMAAANNSLVTATMAERLRQSGAFPSLPDDVQEFLQAVLDSAAERNTLMMTQLCEAAGQLNRAGVRPLLIKGAAILGAPGNRRHAGRILADIDLLVPPRELPDAFAALQAIGYVRDQEAGLAPSAAALSRSKDAGSIDLHDQFYSVPLQFDFDTLQRGAKLVELGDGSAWLPSPTMQLAVLVAHDQLRDRDYWRGHVDIRHLFDAATLIESPEGVDWPLLDSLFPAGVPKSALRTYCRTLHGLLDLPVPRELRRGWRADIQFRRRLLQARWPGITLPGTAVSALLDPPIPPLKLIRRIWHEALHSGRHDLIARIRSRIRTFFDSTRMGKL